MTRDYYRNIAETGIRHHAIQEIVESLGYWKIFAQCFLYCWQRSTNFSEKCFLIVAGTYAVKGNSFLHSILVGDKSCWHYCDPETKWQIMVWHHTILLTKKKPKQSPQPSRPWQLSSGLLKDAYWLNFCHDETISAVGYRQIKVKVKAVCGSYSTDALRHIVLLPEWVPLFISRGTAHTKWHERPLLAKEGTIPGI